MTTNAHTPTPWRVEGSIYEHMAAEIVGERATGECGLAQVWKSPVAMEDAAFIVRAVNAHAELVAALREIKALGSDGEHSGDRHARCRKIADAALAKMEA